MKAHIYIKQIILFVTLPLLLLTCEKYSGENVDFSNTVNAFIRTDDDEFEDEYISYEFFSTKHDEDSAILVTVELPYSISQDVQINYVLKGDAVKGTDYSIADSQSLIIKYDPYTTNLDRAQFVIKPLDDLVEDGEKNLVLEIVSAVTMETNDYLNVGVQNDGISINIFLKDDDCPLASPLEGTYNGMAIYNEDTTYQDIVVSKQGDYYHISDIAVGAFNYVSPKFVPIPGVAFHACGDLVFNNRKGFTIYETLNFSDIKGSITSDSTFKVEWNYVDDFGSLYPGISTFVKK